MAQDLFDALSGAAGHPVDRPALNAYITAGQAQAGLRTAQTEEALANAENLRREQAAQDGLEDNLTQMYVQQGMAYDQANANAKGLGAVMKSHFGNYQQAAAGALDALKTQAGTKLLDPNTPPDAAIRADQVLNPGANPYQVDQGQLIPRMQQTGQSGPPTVFQTPGSQATQSAQTALAGLHGVQAAAGGFNPNKAGVASLPPEQQDAVNQAMHEGRLNFKDINSRNASLIGSMALNSPNYNFNAEAADASLSRNATFQQRAKVVDAMPGLLQNVTSLGKKLNYPDLQMAGLVKQAFMGQNNDPDLVAYATARNDVILKMANVMRGVGMSDKAAEMEHEAWSPTLPPAGLDSWLKAQMSVLTPLIDAQKSAAHIGAPGTSYDNPAPATSSPAAAAGPAPGALPPQAALHLKEGFVTTFSNGQKWTIHGGKPTQVQ